MRDATGNAKRLGASVIPRPQAFENMGFFTVMKDPQGAIFAVFGSK